jgi:hypothetical protein
MPSALSADDADAIPCFLGVAGYETWATGPVVTLTSVTARAVVMWKPTVNATVSLEGDASGISMIWESWDGCRTAQTVLLFSVVTK